ncbi:MAG: CvpA family protein [Bacteroidota bacterium]
MILDLIAAVIITYGFYRGYTNGLIDTVVDIFSILIGAVIALKFSPYLIDYIQKVVHINPAFEFILGFLLLFFGVIFLLRFIGDRMEGLLKAAKVNFLNQLAGGALLGGVFAILIGMGFLMLTNLGILNSSYAAESTLYDTLIRFSQESDWLLNAFKKLFADFWEKFMSTIDSVKSNIDSK